MHSILESKLQKSTFMITYENANQPIWIHMLLLCRKVLRCKLALSLCTGKESQLEMSMLSLQFSYKIEYIQQFITTAEQSICVIQCKTTRIASVVKKNNCWIMCTPVAATADDCLFEFISLLTCTVRKTTNCLHQSELQGFGAWPPPASLIQSLK